MKDYRAWWILFLRNLGFGGILAYMVHIFFKTSLIRSFEYAGAALLLIAVVFFVTTGPRKYRSSVDIIAETMEPKEKTKELRGGDIYYVLAFGLAGLALLIVPVFL